MSTRTVIEINHDYLHDLLEHPENLRLFLQAFAFASMDSLTESAPSGIRVLGRRHHSETIKLTVK